MKKEKYQLFYYNINIDKLIKSGVQYITYQDYLEYKSILQLAESSEEYKLEKNKNEIYDNKKLKEIYNIHDKLIKRVLGTTKEMASFLNQFLDLPEKIKEKNLEQCPTEFITKNYKTKYSDLIFKLKNKNIYFLIEHQSTVDKRMIERIGIYVEEIMRKGIKNNKYPVVIPTVIYTGYSKWNTETSLMEKQFGDKIYNCYKNNLKYNLIEIQKYTFEKLLNKRTLFGSLMVMEKCKTKEELSEKILEINQVIKGKQEREILEEIIKIAVEPQLGKNQTEKIIENIKESEEIGMTPLMKMLLDLEYKGKKEGIRETVQKMIQSKESDDKIIKYTGISKKELKSIKEALG